MSGADPAAPIAFEEAAARARALARPVAGTETLPLAAAAGRALAAPARAPLPLPPFDASAMDGYALRTADFAGDGPWTLPLAGRVAAGDAGEAAAPPGAALRILTGAPVPPGCDAVVMQERVRRAGDAITLDARPEPGRNIRRRGEDAAAGDEVLPAGVAIGAREAAVLAATGHAAAAVRRRLRVALFATGSELAEPGAPLGPGMIWNSNRYMLRAALSAPWVDLEDLGALPDDPATLAAALRGAAARADLVISTGGVSTGDEDHMPRLLREAGGEAAALRIAMKPGKPIALGRLGDAVYLGLPGNPVAAFTSWTVLGAPAARAMAGFAAPARALAVRADFDLDRSPGRCEFRPVRLTGTDPAGAPLAALMTERWAARLSLLAAADGLARLPAGADSVRRGDILEFWPF